MLKYEMKVSLYNGDLQKGIKLLNRSRSFVCLNTQRIKLESNFTKKSILRRRKKAESLFKKQQITKKNTSEE